MLQDKQERNHNSFMMINLCKGETYNAENLYNDSAYEEDKAMIDKMNQQLLRSLFPRKQQDMHNNKKLYHLYLI
jgi:hypothetical protein